MFRSGSVPASRALLYGTLAVGVLDLLDAFVFFGLRSGVRPIRILHSIAAGLLGRASFAGGWRTATLGLALHFFIAFVIVLVFMMASRRCRAAAPRRSRGPALRHRRLSDDDVRRGAGISRGRRSSALAGGAERRADSHVRGGAAGGAGSEIASWSAESEDPGSASPRAYRAARDPSDSRNRELADRGYSSLIATFRISSFIGGPACSWKPINPAIDRPFTSSSTQTAVTCPFTMWMSVLPRAMRWN